MQHATVGDLTLEYARTGTGEPVVFIHGALIADAFQPLLAASSLGDRYQLISYHRRGYRGSSRTTSPVSIAQQAADCRGLLHALGVRRSHIVGHSLGGSIALQLALDAPEVVHSLVLLEPALVVGASAESYRDAMARNRERYSAGDVTGTVDDFLQPRFGLGYRAAFLDQALPGAFAQAVADAGTAFLLDMPAVGEWQFPAVAAGRIAQPVLLVLGSESNALWPRFGETHRLLRQWLPHAEEYVLPGATHALQLQNPGALAPALAQFLARHPVGLLAPSAGC